MRKTRHVIALTQLATRQVPLRNTHARSSAKKVRLQGHAGFLTKARSLKYQWLFYCICSINRIIINTRLLSEERFIRLIEQRTTMKNGAYSTQLGQLMNAIPCKVEEFSQGGADDLDGELVSL